ncbi:unnamed protein product [Urochloa humidicola]
MAPACRAAPAIRRVAAPVPVAWLEGDILAEYLLFLEETVLLPALMRVPVAWLDGDRWFATSSCCSSRSRGPQPRLLLTRFPNERQEREHGRGCAPRYGGLVVDGVGSGFIEDDAGTMEGDDTSGDVAICIEKGEKEEAAATSLPTFRAHAAAPVQ